MPTTAQIGSSLPAVWRNSVRSPASARREALRGSLMQRSGALRTLRARYDAAVTTDDNRRHWANADGLSADAAASPEIRRVLRNRARYEVANNSIARGIVSTLANDVVGTGPRLQMMLENRRDNDQVERAFASWAASIGLAEKLRTMRKSRAESGEAFLLLARNPRIGPVELDVRLIEADQVATPDLVFHDPMAIDGIVFDDLGNPIEYHVLKQHPGDRRAVTLAYDRIRAAAVIHYFRTERPGQSRGIPDITPALPLFAQLRRYTLAVIAAAEAAADVAGVIYSDAPATEPDPVDPMETIEIEQRMWMTLPNGWKTSQIKAEQPATTYGEFKREIINEIARCLDMPFNIAAGNSSGYNYSSGRLDHQTYFKSIRIEQAQIERVVLDRIFNAWIDEAVLITGLLPQSMRTLDASRRHQWFWDGTEHVDPEKEAEAQATRLESRTTSLAREYARDGRDWEAELRQIAKEEQLMDELGLTREQASRRPRSAPSATE